MQHVNTGFYYTLNTLSSVSNRTAIQMTREKRKSKLKKSHEGIFDDSLFSLSFSSCCSFTDRTVVVDTLIAYSSSVFIQINTIAQFCLKHIGDI